jgi:CMP-N,N'-diacetyllegionaminic acid synthase
MADTGILDIDSEEDYELMQVIAKYLFENNEAFKESFNKVKSWK